MAPFHLLRQHTFHGSIFSKAIQVLLLYFFLCLIIIQYPGFAHDIKSYQDWCLYIQRNGLSQAYGSGTNYPPLLHYLLWLFGKIAHSETLLRTVFYYFRALILLFDFLSIYLVWRWAKPGMDFVQLLFYCCILNAAFLYNTIIWGQVDSVGAALIFGALYAGYRSKWILSTVLCILALNMKFQMIIFLPLCGLVLLHGIVVAREWKLLAIVPLVAAGAQVLVLSPFFFGPDGVRAVGRVIFGNVGEMPVLSVHAHNIWYLVFGLPSRELRDDVVTSVGLTYRQLGLILFFASSLVALLPVCRRIYTHSKQSNVQVLSKELIWATGAQIAMLFFYCNTEMHERYQHPAMIFLAAMAFCSGRFWLLALFSFAYFWNLELYVQAFKWPNFIYNSYCLGGYSGAIMFGIVIIALYVKLYRSATRPKTAMPAGSTMIQP